MNRSRMTFWNYAPFLLLVVRRKKIALAVLAARVSLRARMRPVGLSAHKEIPRMPDATTDRRLAPRFPLILLAEVTDLLSAVKFAARTSDLSRTGCYIDMLSPLPRDTQVHVLLKNGGEVFESAAIVIYVSPGLGIGVRFADMPAERRSPLDRWLAAAAKTGG